LKYSSQRSSDLLAGFNGAASRQGRREGEDGVREGRGREKERREERERGKGKGELAPSFLGVDAPFMYFCNFLLYTLNLSQGYASRVLCCIL